MKFILESVFVWLSKDESTLSKSMTIMVGSAQHHQQQQHRGGGGGGVKHHESANRSQSRNDMVQTGGGSESDTSASPINEFSNAPTYRVPTKSSRGKQKRNKKLINLQNLHCTLKIFNSFQIQLLFKRCIQYSEIQLILIGGI